MAVNAHQDATFGACEMGIEQRCRADVAHFAYFPLETLPDDAFCVTQLVLVLHDQVLFNLGQIAEFVTSPE